MNQNVCNSGQLSRDVYLFFSPPVHFGRIIYSNDWQHHYNRSKHACQYRLFMHIIVHKSYWVHRCFFLSDQKLKRLWYLSRLFFRIHVSQFDRWKKKHEMLKVRFGIFHHTHKQNNKRTLTHTHTRTSKCAHFNFLQEWLARSLSIPCHTSTIMYALRWILQPPIFFRI